MYQVIEQTYEEKVEMYRKIDKEELISMLIQANLVISSMKPVVSYVDEPGRLTVGENVVPLTVGGYDASVIEGDSVFKENSSKSGFVYEGYPLTGF
jgi:hypothetical protein